MLITRQDWNMGIVPYNCRLGYRWVGEADPEHFGIGLEGAEVRLVLEKVLSVVGRFLHPGNLLGGVIYARLSLEQMLDLFLRAAIIQHKGFHERLGLPPYDDDHLLEIEPKEAIQQLAMIKACACGDPPPIWESELVIDLFQPREFIRGHHEACVKRVIGWVPWWIRRETKFVIDEQETRLLEPDEIRFKLVAYVVHAMRWPLGGLSTLDDGMDEWLLHFGSLEQFLTVGTVPEELKNSYGLSRRAEQPCAIKVSHADM